MGFIVTRYRLLIFLCFIHYNVHSHLVHSSHRFPDLFKTDRDEGAKTRVSEGTPISRLSIKSGHDWRSSDAFMARQSGDASSETETHRENLAWKDSVERRLRDLEMGCRSIPEEQADPEVKRESDTCRGDIKRLTGEVIQVRRELEAAKTELKDVKNALTTINNDREAHIDIHMTRHGTQESITNPISHLTDDALKAFKHVHGELKKKLDHQDETILNLNKTKGNGVVELKKELQNQVSSEQKASTKLHIRKDHLIHDTIFENLKVAIDSQYVKSTASPTKRRRRSDGIGALTTAITSFMSELQQYNKTIQHQKTELMRMPQDSVVKLDECQTDVRTLAQNLAKTERVLDLLHVGLREEKRFVRRRFDAFKDSLNSFINQRDLLETNMNETTDSLTSVSDALSDVMVAVDSVSTNFSTFRDNYNTSTNAQIDELKDDVDTLKMLYKGYHFDDCQSSPCVHGTCVDGINNYTCNCPSGFHGDLCETDIDDCQASPCVHGTCVDGINNYTCNCPSGFHGDLCETVRSCFYIHQLNNNSSSGVYSIRLDDEGRKVTKQVYCDMETDGGGWTVVQRRLDGSVNFTRNFTEYVNGFGNINGEYWLGLKWMRIISNAEPQRLRVDLVAGDNTTAFASYSTFNLDSDSLYTLRLGSYSGNSSVFHRVNYPGMTYNNRAAFATYDKDNIRGCGRRDAAGWWFKYCTFVNINGVYYVPGKECSVNSGYRCLTWHGFKGIEALRGTSMKLRNI